MRNLKMGGWMPADLIKLANQPFDVAHEGEGGDGGSGGGNNNSGGGGSGGDYVSKSVMETLIADRDRAKADLANAQKTIDDLNKTKAALDELTGGDLDKFKQSLADLQKFKKDADATTKTEIEKAQAALKEATDNHAKELTKRDSDHKKALEALQKTVEEQKASIAGLQGYKLNSEIYKAAVENGAANADQIVLMLKNSFALNDKGEFTIQVKDEKTGQELPYGVAEYIKTFLAKPENANLLAATDKDGKKPRDTNINNKAPGEPNNKGKENGKEENKTDGKTWLEKLGRPITDQERSEFRVQGLTDEEIAMNIVLRQQAKERVKKARDGKSDLFGESTY